jgi:hypothetical protein
MSGLVAELMFTVTIAICVFVFMLIILASFGFVEPLLMVLQ